MTKQELKLEIKKAKQSIFIKDSYMKCFFVRNIKIDHFRLIKNYLKYHFHKNLFFKAISYRKYAKYSRLLNVQINCKNVLKGFQFSHQNVVINQNCVIGENLLCIGNNCIGKNDKGAPKLGNNVTLGYGATIIGNVKIADNVYIGAGAIVTKDVLIPGSKVVGLNKVL